MFAISLVSLCGETLSVPGVALQPVLCSEGVYQLMAALVGHLQTFPVQIQFYLDDILNQSSSESQAWQDLRVTIQVLHDHGFSVNRAKSHLIPKTCLLHLGAIIDMVASKVYLSLDRQASLKELVIHVLEDRTSFLFLLSQLLGKMVSCFGIIPWARLHNRALQWYLLPFQRSCQSTSLTCVVVLPVVLVSLSWWRSDTIVQGCRFWEPQCIILTTNASLFGWGGHLSSNITQGQWSPEDLTHNINWLELQAAHLALQSFTDLVSGKDILVLTDNVAAKAHINCQGGTRFLSLMQVAEQLILWAESHLASIWVDHILGVANIQADCSVGHQ